jgi:hypothetical protein
VANEREKSVFINCPYDTDYRPIFDALIFTVVACGFYPKSAQVSGQVALPRMQRIAEALFSSKYSIHDLSRCRGEGDENLARFNMPLELGIAMAQKYSDDVEHNDHDWCLLVPRGNQYKRFLSDLAGYDPREYDGDQNSAVRAVMGWLVVTPDAPAEPPSPRQVLNVVGHYHAAVGRLRDDWGQAPPWPYLVKEAITVAREQDLIPAADVPPN